MKKYITPLVGLLLVACVPAEQEHSTDTSSSSISYIAVSSSSASAFDQDWTTFRSESFGYSLRLPPSFELISGEFGSMEKPVVKLVSSEGMYVDASVEPTDTASLGEYLQEYDDFTSTAWEGDSSIDVSLSEAMTIDDRHVVVRDEWWNAAGFEAISLYTLVDGRIYRISFYGDEMRLDPSRRPLAQKVFETLRWE